MLEPGPEKALVNLTAGTPVEASFGATAHLGAGAIQNNIQVVPDVVQEVDLRAI